MPDLPPSDFFDLAPIGIRARSKTALNLSRDDVLEALSKSERSVCVRQERSGAEPTQPRARAKRHKGLSNAPYLTAAAQQILEMQIRPASTLFRVRPARRYGEFDQYSDTPIPRNRSKRGRIKEFSGKSRLGLQLLAADLQTVVRKPDLMVTLTYPGEWESVTTDWACRCEASEGCSDVPCICTFAPSGKVCKRHLDTFYKRVKRYLKAHNISGWGCLWFLEFQKRGAPHFHLMFFGFGFVLFDLAEFQGWLSEAWADIVGHADPVEFQKHLNAGTNAEWTKKEHFGYALKYAAKMKQKEVPAEFANIGRFWGCWHNPLGSPVLKALYTASDTLKRMAVPLCTTLYQDAPVFLGKVYAALRTAENNSVFTFRLFGQPTSDYLLSYGAPKPVPLQC